MSSMVVPEVFILRNSLHRAKISGLLCRYAEAVVSDASAVQLLCCGVKGLIGGDVGDMQEARCRKVGITLPDCWSPLLGFADPDLHLAFLAVAP
ncbi:hypothetical protein, partial [uncultured Bifidobacterium sp.]|uniref:hypothetical protein n=1 Tax=uncultured Bifidobacterium sp. TaxID=165187 RepID=UPI0026269A49